MLQEVVQEHPTLLNRASTLHRLDIQWSDELFVYNHWFLRDNTLWTLMEIKWLFMYLYLWKLKQKLFYLCFLIPISSPIFGDLIPVLTQYMLMGFYVLTIRNGRDICANRYNQHNPRNHQNERIDHSNYDYRKGK
ncbi:DNA-directed RNA polymerase subunit beta' [Nymphaea thermarum]|nr:DNA-directed RNA polymerase subunit beta' [Nymphaea thermarum]